VNRGSSNAANRGGVLIVSDDTEFVRAVVSHWRGESHAPEITVAATDVWRPGGALSYQLVIFGPVRNQASSVLQSVATAPGLAAICVAEDDAKAAALRGEYPQLPVLARRGDWLAAVLMISTEILRRSEMAERASRAERLAQGSHRHAALGRYMLEMRPSVNDALTSVLGNADLLLLDSPSADADSREQIRTIHAMALRLNEVMQRFSSLASELQTDEKESQAETIGAAPGAAFRY
jgi:hypothetical protein